MPYFPGIIANSYNAFAEPLQTFSHQLRSHDSLISIRFAKHLDFPISGLTLCLDLKSKDLPVSSYCPFLPLSGRVPSYFSFATSSLLSPRTVWAQFSHILCRCLRDVMGVFYFYTSYSYVSSDFHQLCSVFASVPVGIQSALANNHTVPSREEGVVGEYKHI